MRSTGRWSRRTLLQYCLAAGFFPRLRAAQAGTNDPVMEALIGFARRSCVSRRYRVDATVLFLGVPLFTKKNVGGGYATVETGIGADAQATALQFAAGSWPNHAAGLNRFGILREVVIERESKPLGFTIAGLITHNPEQNFDEARNTLLSHSPKALEATIAAGELRNGAVMTATENIQLAPGSVWTGAAEELAAVIPQTKRQLAGHGAPLLAPFLYVMRRAALGAAERSRHGFLHNGQPYSLEVKRQASKPGELAGEIHNTTGAKIAEFHASYDANDSSGIPVRIEYRAKSFLRLVFELDRAPEKGMDQPSIQPVFPEESI